MSGFVPICHIDASNFIFHTYTLVYNGKEAKAKMAKYGLLCAILLVVLVQPGVVQARDVEAFDPYIKSADLIVEGYVLTQESAPARPLNSRVGAMKTSLRLGLETAKVSKFYVTKVLKGNLLSGDIITVNIDQDAPFDVSPLQMNKDYFLLLEERKNRNGYFVSRKGRAQWQIFECEGQQKLKAWHQDNRYRPASAYQDYAAFLGQLQKCLTPTAVCELKGY